STSPTFNSTGPSVAARAAGEGWESDSTSNGVLMVGGARRGERCANPRITACARSHGHSGTSNHAILVDLCSTGSEILFRKRPHEIGGRASGVRHGSLEGCLPHGGKSRSRHLPIDAELDLKHTGEPLRSGQVESAI